MNSMIEKARLVTAPGRVNLIGEHTDYNLLPVFPVALQRKVEIRFRPRADSKVRLRSADPAFGEREFDLAPVVPPYQAGDWGNYAKAAAQALAAGGAIRRGLDGVVGGDLPMSAGLSSSSALVVATAMALLDANGVELDRVELAELLAHGEHYVGTEGGGMDQAICLGGVRGHAVLIEFAPLRLHPVPVPEGWRFLIAHSLVTANKSAEARQHFNQRVRSCRAAFAELGLDMKSAREADQAELLARAERSLTGSLLQCFRHTVSEGRRVWQARQALLGNDAREFGRLMQASHASLRDDYQVSHPEVDRLVDVAMNAGALGARVTGAGFGGFIVALAEAARADAVREKIERDFYGTRESQVLLVEPSDGARVCDA
jgi:galactokinase